MYVCHTVTEPFLRREVVCITSCIMQEEWDAKSKTLGAQLFRYEMRIFGLNADGLGISVRSNRIQRGQEMTRDDKRLPSLASDGIPP